MIGAFFSAAGSADGVGCARAAISTGADWLGATAGCAVGVFDWPLVVGSADDPRLTEWRVSAATQADVAIELGPGTEPLPGASELASLDLLSDGVHTLDFARERTISTRHTPRH